jgi:hypothetical protein
MLIMEWMGKMRMRIREVGGDIGMYYIGFFTLDIGPEDWKHQFYMSFDIEHGMSTSDIEHRTSKSPRNNSYSVAR